MVVLFGYEGVTMYSSTEKVKKELQQLCNDYLDILKRLKDEDIINKETFDSCSLSKKIFLEE